MKFKNFAELEEDSFCHDCGIAKRAWDDKFNPNYQSFCKTTMHDHRWLLRLKDVKDTLELK